MAADRGRAVLAVLGDQRADARGRRARRGSGRAAAHPPGRDGRRGGVLPGAVRRPPVEYAETSAGSATTSGWRTASTSTSARSPVRRDRHRRRALPRSNARLGAGIAPGPRCSTPARRSGSASTAPRPTRPASSPASCARRCWWPGCGRPAGAHRPRGARAGHDRRRPLPGREDEIGSLEPGKLADLALWRLDGLGHAGIEDPVAALVLGPRPPLAHAAGRRPTGGRGRPADHRRRGTSRATSPDREPPQAGGRRYDRPSYATDGRAGSARASRAPGRRRSR